METRRKMNEQSHLLPKPSGGANVRQNIFIADTSIETNCLSTSVEVVALFFLFSKILSDTLIVNFLEFKTCRVVFNYNVSMCIDPISEKVEGQIQPIVANIVMIRTFAESLFPSLFVLFAGPWSDSNGRKTFLMISLAGLSCSYTLWGILSVFPQIRPEYFLLASIPVIFTGGSCTVFMSLYCYLCDVTTIEDRAIRMAVLQFVYNVGSLFGAASAPQLFNSFANFPFTGVFMISSAILMTAVIYIYVCLSESITILEGRQTNLIQLEYVQELFKVCFQERPYHARVMILLIAGTLGITVFIIQGENGVLYLSLREMFGWQLETYSFYASLAMIFNCIGGLVGVWLFISVLNFPVMPMAIAVAFCKTIQALINASSSKDFYFYISSAIGCLINMIGALTRLEISRLMPQHDLGKIMAFISFLEAICPIIASPMYTFLYDATFDTYPSAIFWLSSALSLIPVGFLITVVMLQYLQDNFRYTEMDPVEVQ